MRRRRAVKRGVLRGCEAPVWLTSGDAYRIRRVYRKLAGLKGANGRERIVELERSKEAVLEHYAAIAPAALDALTSGERRRLYGLLRLEGVLHPDGNPEVSLPFGAGVSVPESTC